MADTTDYCPLISMIVAMDKNNLIGVNNSLPWKLPADMKWFVKNTTTKPILMGRKTFESFGAKPLKNRHNIIVSRNPDYKTETSADVVYSVEAALECAQGTEIAAKHKIKEIMVIGGSSFYRQLLARAGRLYITRVEAEFEGDSWFPEIDPRQWKTVFSQSNPADADNVVPYTFIILERIM